jgi:anti-sigma-K factor RskA
MTETDDIDATAAEYVLGTLDARERSAVDQRRGSEPALARAIAEWEVRLGPLNDLVPPRTAPAGLRDLILARVADAERANVVTVPQANSNIVILQQRVARWRAAALGATALAASLAGLVAYREALRPALAKSYVAVLQKDAASPAFLMTVNVEARTMTIRPVAAAQMAGKSYELWLVHEKLGAPKSLGVVGDQAFSMAPKLASFASGDIKDATYAVSLEPEGGSPTGAPTGPVLYAGKLVQANP